MSVESDGLAKKDRHRSGRYPLQTAAVLVALAVAGQLATLATVLDLDGSWLARLLFFRFHLVEWLGMALLACWCLGAGRWRRWIFGCLLFVFFEVIVVQLLAVCMTHATLTADALSNTADLYLMASRLTLGAVAGAAVLAAILWWSVAGLDHRASGALARLGISGVILAAVVLLLFAPVLAPAEARRAAAALKERHSGVEPPFSGMVWLLLRTAAPASPFAGELTHEDLHMAREFGLELEPRAEYPLIKDWIWRDDLPFAVSEGSDRCNVIVLFSESLSARKLGAYGCRYADLTPNIDAFARQSMRVDNYFNHTAATYRALRGQLCSLFPFHGGGSGWQRPGLEASKVRLFGLPRLLRAAGYSTVFMGAEAADKAEYGLQVGSVGFEHALFRDDIVSLLLDGEEPGGRHLGDHQMMRAVLRWLGKDRSQEPFFLFVSTVGTHPNLDCDQDGSVYGDGSNPVLNTTHSFDEAFGLMWQGLSESDLASSTVLVLTADHPHWPSPAYLEMAGAGCPRSFVDRIALIINSPCHQLPRRWDAHNATSLAFAPTLAHLLRLPNLQNHFLGRSLFDRRRQGLRTIGVGFYDNVLSFIDDKGRVRNYSLRKPMPSWAERLARVLRFTQQLELSDRVWDAEVAGHMEFSEVPRPD